MKIVRTADGRASILDLSAEQFSLMLDGINEVNRSDNPARPFSRSLQTLLDGLRLELGKGAKLFRPESRPDGSTVYRLRPRPVHLALVADRDPPRSL